MVKTNLEIAKIFGWLLFPILAALPGSANAESAKPNIVYILADDLGYGDVKCLNPRGKIETPHMDRIGREGMIFTDAHSSSAVCTPSRYSILTGRYCWRTKLQSYVLEGDSEPLIEPNQLTVGAFLKQQGYHTACIGKWHLGMNLPSPKEWMQPIKEGPVARGFDYYFGISASLDMGPYVFLENDRITENPSVRKKWIREAPAAPGFEAVDVLPKLTAKAVGYIEERKKAGGPFFLYFPLTSPHTPIVPSPEWRGKSQLGDYGDFVMETDWAIGEVLAALDRAGLAQNTLVICTSDNGCSPAADFAALAKLGHHPSGGFRGEKSDIWDGGHRIPFLVRWPGHIEAGSKSGQTVCLGDFMATTADLLGTKLPEDGGVDSVSLLPALLGKATKPLREFNIYHSIDGNFAIQEGKWKLVLCAGSGGWSYPKNTEALEGGLPPVQLYDMSADIGERKNGQGEHPEIVQRLTKLLEKCVSDGRSTPGPQAKNDVPVNIWKEPKRKAKP